MTRRCADSITPGNCPPGFDIYCSESAWPTVRQAFTDAKVAEPWYWIAAYPGSVGDALFPGSAGHQWIDRGPYDESIFVDYIPGIDPPPPTPQAKGKEVLSDVVQSKPGQLDYFQVSPAGDLYHKWS